MPQRGRQRVHVGRHAGRTGGVQHLGRRPGHRQAGVLLLGGRHLRRDAEVGQPGLLEGSEQDVGRLDVPMQDACPVRRLHRRADLDADLQRFRHREQLAPHPGRQAAVRVVGHHDVGAMVGGRAGGVHAHDEGVLQLGHRVGLGDEHLAGPGRHRGIAQHLHGDLPVGVLLLIEIDVGEATGAQVPEVAEPRQVGGRKLPAHSVTSNTHWTTPASTTSVPGSIVMGSPGRSWIGSRPGSMTRVPLVDPRSFTTTCQ